MRRLRGGFSTISVFGTFQAEKREPIEQVLATVDVLAEGQRGQGERGNFSNLVSQPEL